VRTARKYFAHALELKPQHNLRALYGLLLCISAVGKGGKGGKENNAEIVALVRRTLAGEYKENAKPGMLKLVEAMVDKLLV
tara:strand:+ start:37 stop:279 length:243 start_codon:yes stop_codon:yes gene_type:complete